MSDMTARLTPPSVRVRDRARLRRSGFVHPQAASGSDEGQHDWALDIASDSAANYLRWIAEMCEPYLGKSVLELGAGHGSVTQHLAVGRELLATDLSDSCYDALQRRFADQPNVRISRQDLRTTDIDETFDSIVMINTLEHIEDDAGSLERLRPLLRASGQMIIYVPAFNWLYSDYDRKVGHFRRYDRPQLERVFADAGYETITMRYANVLAMPAWLVIMRLLHRDAAEDGSLDVWDRFGTPSTKWLESKVQFPFGLNLFAVARPR